jgi:hypothetical protein
MPLPPRVEVKGRKTSFCPPLLSTDILLDFRFAKWAVSFLTHSSNPFPVL